MEPGIAQQIVGMITGIGGVNKEEEISLPRDFFLNGFFRTYITRLSSRNATPPMAMP